MRSLELATGLLSRADSESAEASSSLAAAHRSPEHAPGAIVQLDSEDVSKRARIMVVDDEPINVKAVETYLRTFGYKDFVTTTESLHALDLIWSRNPNLVLLDIMMPEMDGIELLRQIRDDEELTFLPVIILTACCDQNTKREGLESGASDFLSKPVDPNELALRVGNLLSIKSHHDTLAEYARKLKRDVQIRTEQLMAAKHEAELRYLAGKAEIATDVLHNVGNVLQSVNITVNLVEYTLRESRLPSLKRASSLLQENSDRLVKFLTKDERGRALPGYLAELTDALLEEREGSLREIRLLMKHIEHIKATVATQQKYAGLCAVMEPVSLPELLHDAEELVSASLDKYDVEVVRAIADIPHVRTDKQRMLQVLVNLLKNAVQSVSAAEKAGTGRLEIRVRLRGGDSVCIDIIDNGVGFPEESVVKMFSHGFTTKSDGNGFGLHSSANIMKGLGGRIKAHSKGPGMGATFTVELPLGEGAGIGSEENAT